MPALTAKAARRSPKGEVGRTKSMMTYVYLLQSIDHPEERYVGRTVDLKSRFAAHNAGRSPHTAKFRPWRLVTYVAFSDEQKAVDFERYLKSASGRAFANKRLR
jgi:putative endonuclease